MLRGLGKTPVCEAGKLITQHIASALLAVWDPGRILLKSRVNKPRYLGQQWPEEAYMVSF